MGYVTELQGRIAALQEELADYQNLYEMERSDLVILLNSLVRAELTEGFVFGSANWKRKMRVQNVLSERR